MKLQCKRQSINMDGHITKDIIQEHTAHIKIGFDERLWVHLSPGVTGYESASVDDLLKHNGEWYACAGTPGSWDRLIVPKEEMERLKDILRLLPQPPKI